MRNNLSIYYSPRLVLIAENLTDRMRNFVMSFETYQKGMEEREKKDLEIHELKEQMNKIQEAFKLYAAHANELTKEVFEKIKQQERNQKEEGRRQIIFKIIKKAGLKEEYLQA